MTYEISVGERKSLVFPVLCHGHLRIDYSDEVAGQNYGIFGHDESVTIQTILTPYDINGFGFELTGSDNPDGKMGVVNSKKTAPAIQSKDFDIRIAGGLSNKTFGSTSLTKRDFTESGAYFSVGTDYQKTSGYEMMVFYNSNLQLSLIEGTNTNVNQPSEYKIKLAVLVNGASDSITTTDVVIKANNITSDSTRWKGTTLSYGYNSNGSGAAYEQIGTLTGSSSTGSTDVNQVLTGGVTNQLFSADMKLYKRSGQTFTHAATVATTAGDATFTVDTGHSLVNDDVLYIEAYKEALYLVTPYHIAASYDVISGNMNIYLNGKVIATKKHTNFGEDFEIAAEDCFIGADNNAGANAFSETSGTEAADKAEERRQFMGEIHEFAITKGIPDSFMNIDTLIPNYRQTLLYFRFEEVDL